MRRQRFSLIALPIRDRVVERTIRQLAEVRLSNLSPWAYGGALLRNSARRDELVVELRAVPDVPGGMVSMAIRAQDVSQRLRNNLKRANMLNRNWGLPLDAQSIWDEVHTEREQRYGGYGRSPLGELMDLNEQIRRQVNELMMVPSQYLGFDVVVDPAMAPDSFALRQQESRLHRRRLPVPTLTVGEISSNMVERTELGEDPAVLTVETLRHAMRILDQNEIPDPSPRAARAAAWNSLRERIARAELRMFGPGVYIRPAPPGYVVWMGIDESGTFSDGSMFNPPMPSREAADKGLALLKRHLTDEQRQSLEEFGHFCVKGGISGVTYRIDHGAVQNVYVCGGADGTYGICFTPWTHQTPYCAGDCMLAQKLAIELEELDVVRIAIPFGNPSRIGDLHRAHRDRVESAAAAARRRECFT